MKKNISLLLIVLLITLLPIFGQAKGNNVKLYLFHGDGCPHCREEIKFLKTLEKQYTNLEIIKYEVWYNDDNALLLSKIEKAYDLETSGVPTTIIGDNIYQGYTDQIGEQIEDNIKYCSKNTCIDQITNIKNGSFDKPVKKEKTKKGRNLNISVPFFGKVNLKKVSIGASAVIIGLVDGFNPCAMWILLFLISTLIGMKNRKRMWALGLTFLVTSALMYMLIMLSWISIAVKITTIIWIRNLIAVIALIGAFINLKGFFKNTDSGCEVVDAKKRKTIFAKIRKFTSEKSFILALLGVMGLAVSVNLVELACSAGLPLVFTEILALNDVSSSMKLVYTFLYILFFLLDDLIVFFIAMITMKVTGLSTKYNKYSHLIGGIIMLIIGILLILKPEWLMFNFK